MCLLIAENMCQRMDMMEGMIRANRSRIKGRTGVWQEMSAKIPKEKFMESLTTRTLEALTTSRRWQ